MKFATDDVAVTLLSVFLVSSSILLVEAVALFLVVCVVTVASERIIEVARDEETGSVSVSDLEAEMDGGRR